MDGRWMTFGFGGAGGGVEVACGTGEGAHGHTLRPRLAVVFVLSGGPPRTLTTRQIVSPCHHVTMSLFIN